MLANCIINRGFVFETYNETCICKLIMRVFSYFLKFRNIAQPSTLLEIVIDNSLGINIENILFQESIPAEAKAHSCDKPSIYRIGKLLRRFTEGTVIYFLDRHHTVDGKYINAIISPDDQMLFGDTLFTNTCSTMYADRNHYVSFLATSDPSTSLAMNNLELSRPKDIVVSDFFNQTSDCGVGCYPDELSLIMFNCEKLVVDGLSPEEALKKQQIADIMANVSANRFDQTIVQDALPENAFDIDKSLRNVAANTAHTQAVATVFTTDVEIESQTEEATPDADTSFVPTFDTLKSKPSTEEEETLVDVLWTKQFEVVSKHSILPSSREPKYFGRGIVVYSNKRKPQAEHQIGIWLKTANAPFRGSLHFGHEFLQTQPNFMQPPYSENIWQVCPIENEWLKLAASHDNTHRYSLIAYSDTEKHNIRE